MESALNRLQGLFTCCLLLRRHIVAFKRLSCLEIFRTLELLIYLRFDGPELYFPLLSKGTVYLLVYQILHLHLRSICKHLLAWIVVHHWALLSMVTLQSNVAILSFLLCTLTNYLLFSQPCVVSIRTHRLFVPLWHLGVLRTAGIVCRTYHPLHLLHRTPLLLEMHIWDTSIVVPLIFATCDAPIEVLVVGLLAVGRTWVVLGCALDLACRRLGLDERRQKVCLARIEFSHVLLN